MKITCSACRFENPPDTRFCGNCGKPLPYSPDDHLHLAKTLTLDTPSLRLERGTVFAGRYEIIEELGRGGMGSVYRVMDKKIKEEVALKIIRPDIVDEKTKVRFENELKYARMIAHRNVCRMYDLGEEKGTHFITMEYVPGEDLKSMIKMTRQLGVRTSITIAKQICEGLSEAHRHGIIHRDLKPSNVLLDKEGNVRILDFGIARSLNAKRKTVAGVMMGTPEYMSPEQAEAKQADHQSDIYSLGVILFEMLTGRVPFEGVDPLGIAVQHKLEKPPNPRAFNPSIPSALNRLILKCLEKDKKNRYQNTEELRSDLIDIEKDLTSTDRPAPRRKSPTSREITVTFHLKKLFLPALLSLAAIVIGIVGWKYLFGNTAFASAGDPVSMAVIHFENQTGDDTYDYLQEAIPNLLITSLEQAKSIRVTSWERLHDLVEQAGREEVQTIDRDLGFELCRLDGIQVIILGTFTKAENMFATDVKVLDVETKSLLKSVSSRGEGVDSILRKQIDELSREIRQSSRVSSFISRLGATQIADVTTDSMEAYNYFLRGREDFEKYYFNDARRFLEKAVELDPDFALAYYYLVRVYAYLGNTAEMEKASENFKKYGKKLKGRERLFIEATLNHKKDPQKSHQLLMELTKKYPKWKRAHFELALSFERAGKTDEAIETLNKALELDPNYGYALNQLAYLHSFRNEFDKALEYFRKYAAVSPGDANPFDSMGETYFRMGKLDEAIQKFKEALEVKPDFGSDWKIAYLYALKKDYPEAGRWLDRFIAMASTESLKAQGYLWKAFYCSMEGKLEQALHEIDRAQELARQVNNMRMVDVAYRSMIWTSYDWGRMDLFRKFARERYDFRAESQYRPAEENALVYAFYMGMLELRKGNTAAARNRLAEVQSIHAKMPDELKESNSVAEKYLLSHVLLAEGSADEAVAVFDEIPSTMLSFADFYAYIYKAIPYRADFAARGYSVKGDLDRAVAEYEKLAVFDPSQAAHQPPVHPFSHLRLAKLYEEKEMVEKAAEQYTMALSYWQDADEGLVPVKEAREGLGRTMNASLSGALPRIP